MLREQREILSLVRLPVPPLQPQNHFSSGFAVGASQNYLFMTVINA